jgi:hypothetical protein
VTRWPFRIVAAFLAVWLGYAVSPYLALFDLVGAVEERDTERLRERTNLSAIRFSLSKQLIASYLAEAAPEGSLSSAERQTATAAIAHAIDPIVAAIVTPEGLLSLLQGVEPNLRLAPPEPVAADATPAIAAPVAKTTASAAGPLVRGTTGLANLWSLILRSRQRGFRNLYFVVPPDAPLDNRFRLQFRISALRWRLVDVELPYRFRQRVAQELVRAAVMPNVGVRLRR